MTVPSTYLGAPFEVGVLHHGSIEQLLVEETVDFWRDQRLQHDVQVGEVVGGDILILKRRVGKLARPPWPQENCVMSITAIALSGKEGGGLQHFQHIGMPAPCSRFLLSLTFVTAVCRQGQESDELIECALLGRHSRISSPIEGPVALHMSMLYLYAVCAQLRARAVGV